MESTHTHSATTTTYEQAKDYPYADRLPNSLFKENRDKFISNVKSRVGDKLAKNGVALYKGVDEIPLYNSDCNYPVYQEGCFYYLFGVVEPSCMGVIDFQNEKAILFIPKMDNLYKIWMTVLSKEDFAAKYEVETRYIEELGEYLKE